MAVRVGRVVPPESTEVVRVSTKPVIRNTFAEYAENKGWPVIDIEARPNGAGVAAVRADGSQCVAESADV